MSRARKSKQGPLPCGNPALLSLVIAFVLSWVALARSLALVGGVGADGGVGGSRQSQPTDCGGSFDQHQQQQQRRGYYDYDLVIVGAGASGLFACSAAMLLGTRTALIERDPGIVVGGDCSNAACVPSKALRSMARLASTRSRAKTTMTTTKGMTAITAPSEEAEDGSESTFDEWIRRTRRHVAETVQAVRRREDAESIRRRYADKLDLFFVTDCHFAGPHELEIREAEESGITSGNNNEETIPSSSDVWGRRTISSRKFLICTGASPVVPVRWREQAAAAGDLPISTYRTFLRPECRDPIWTILAEEEEKRNRQQTTGRNKKKRRLLIVGGGATACELGQALGRLTSSSSPPVGRGADQSRRLVEVVLLAPAILPREDVRLQRAARELLAEAGVRCHLQARLEEIRPDRTVVASDGVVLEPVDAVLVCVGRSPLPSLTCLRLHEAGVAVVNVTDHDDEMMTCQEQAGGSGGVLVNPRNLRSVTARHVYASGDCASVVRDRSRTAAQAAWTGFHAVRNARIPSWLRIGAGRSVHGVVPRVIYTDPELACVGLTLSECIERHGRDGFDVLFAPERGSDRADMESQERETGLCFVELRSDRPSGRILGCTICGPAAAELANSMGMAITNSLTVRDIARSLHSYPSHGYLLHRIALSASLNNVWGLLEAAGGGLLPGFTARCGRLGEATVSRIRSLVQWPHRKKAICRRRRWEGLGASQALYLQGDWSDMPTSAISYDDNVRVISYLDAYLNSTLRDEILEGGRRQGSTWEPVGEFLKWLDEEPY